MAKLINGVAFDISQPYVEGHTINAAEAKVLNQTRAENIGNNLRARLKEMVEAGESEDALRALVAERDAEYVFTLSNAGESRRADPVERAAMKIAKEQLKLHLAETGRKLNVAPEGYTEDEWAEKIDAELERVSQHPDVVAAAKKEVEARTKRADKLAAALQSTL